MKKITELKEGQIEVDGIIYTPEVKAYKRWRAEERERYWFVDEFGDATNTPEYSLRINDYEYATSNYFQTEDEAIAKRDYDLALQVIKDSAEGFVPDWGDGDQEKWEVSYSYHTLSFFVNDVDTNQAISGTVFPSKDLLEKSLEENKKEWEIIRDYKG